MFRNDCSFQSLLNEKKIWAIYFFMKIYNLDKIPHVSYLCTKIGNIWLLWQVILYLHVHNIDNVLMYND